jgi:hypothetical protein
MILFPFSRIGLKNKVFPFREQEQETFSFHRKRNNRRNQKHILAVEAKKYATKFIFKRKKD